MAHLPARTTETRLEYLAILGTSAAILLSAGCLGEIGGGSPTDHIADPGGFVGLDSTPEPGESCGAPGARPCVEGVTWVDGGPERNACDGTSALAEIPGSPCGACGVWTCEGPEQVSCEDPGENACGGCTALSKPVGGACNTCGTWTCSGAEAVTCDEPQCLPCLAQNFDISQVAVWRGRSDARNWPVVSDLTVDVVGSWLYFDFDQPETWVGDGATCSEFFVIYKDAGVWVAQIADYLGCDESQHQKYGFFDDWGPNNEWYQISPGDPVGFLVTSQSMSGGAHIPMYERTSVHMMCW